MATGSTSSSVRTCWSAKMRSRLVYCEFQVVMDCGARKFAMESCCCIAAGNPCPVALGPPKPGAKSWVHSRDGGGACQLIGAG